MIYRPTLSELQCGIADTDSKNHIPPLPCEPQEVSQRTSTSSQSLPELVHQLDDFWIVQRLEKLLRLRRQHMEQSLSRRSNFWRRWTIQKLLRLLRHCSMCWRSRRSNFSRRWTIQKLLRLLRQHMEQWLSGLGKLL